MSVRKYQIICDIICVSSEISGKILLRMSPADNADFAEKIEKAKKIF